MVKDRSSVIISIFKRKGGEGELTKILYKKNDLIKDFCHLFPYLIENENPLIVYYKDDFNYLILTNLRLILTNNRIKEIIPFEDILSVKPFFNSYKFGQFKELELHTKENRYIVEIEQGEPFQGLLQVISYLTTNNPQM